MRGTTVLSGDDDVAGRPGALPMHRLEVPVADAVPFAIGTFDTIGPMARAAFPHRHTFYEIVHVTDGRGVHVTDLAHWPLRPPHLGFLVPGQVHHWEDAAGVDGSVVLFTEDFLLDHPGDRALLRLLAERPWPTLDERSAGQAGRLLADLHDEYARGADGCPSVLRALLHVLVVRASRLYGVGSAAHDRPGTRPGAVAEEFTRLIGGGDPALWSVGACAARIGVTPGHLADAVKAATGRTPGQLVREARAHEAKRLLARTELTVRQVAGRVGFDDAAYFCRFFRRETGASPGDFRRGAEVRGGGAAPQDGGAGDGRTEGGGAGDGRTEGGGAEGGRVEGRGRARDIHHDDRVQSIARPRRRA
ncbi:helix-turn-helix transcriptional regulator [Streptomyces roseolilacinus]|uniref:AraC family transcriptional regulator n=1 Tax=Streptomyces roseolilacinus TaxID=66904 RepID=A0A918EHV9_9ACTN|nr:AraC family transcriptional regulator [Streptomyces roseolilacinus]GGP92094.1 AraC family transcriptional regulator [Streptomyces roseolilacinus]